MQLYLVNDYVYFGKVAAADFILRECEHACCWCQSEGFFFLCFDEVPLNLIVTCTKGMGNMGFFCQGRHVQLIQKILIRRVSKASLYEIQVAEALCIMDM